MGQKRYEAFTTRRTTFITEGFCSLAADAVAPHPIAQVGHTLTLSDGQGTAYVFYWFAWQQWGVVGGR